MNQKISECYFKVLLFWRFFSVSSSEESEFELSLSGSDENGENNKQNKIKSKLESMVWIESLNE